MEPDREQVQRLLHALPQHQKMLLPLLAEEFAGMTQHTQEIEDIPSIFYAQVLRGSTRTAAAQHDSG